MTNGEAREMQSDARWVWYGGRPSLDLVNTRRNREAAPVEYLGQPADLADWLRAAALVTAARFDPDASPPPDGALLADASLLADDALLADARELREAIDAGIRAAVTGQPFPPAALVELNRWLAAAPQARAITRSTLRDSVPVCDSVVSSVTGKRVLPATVATR